MSSRLTSTLITLSLAISLSASISQAQREGFQHGGTSCKLIFATDLSPSLGTGRSAQDLDKYYRYRARSDCRVSGNALTENRYDEVTLEIRNELGAPDIPHSRYIEEQLDHCHRLAILAYSNPARFTFFINIGNAYYNIEQDGFGNPFLIARVTQQSSIIQCDLQANRTGLE